MYMKLLEFLKQYFFFLKGRKKGYIYKKRNGEMYIIKTFFLRKINEKLEIDCNIY